VCDACGAETREVHVQEYAPSHDPSGNETRGRRAA
jgi:hypothetical protein